MSLPFRVSLCDQNINLYFLCLLRFFLVELVPAGLIVKLDKPTGMILFKLLFRILSRKTATELVAGILRDATLQTYDMNTELQCHQDFRNLFLGLSIALYPSRNPSGR